MGDEERICLDSRRTRALEKLSAATGVSPVELLDQLLEEHAMHLERKGVEKGLVEEIRRSLDRGETVSHAMDHMVYLGASRKND